MRYVLELRALRAVSGGSCAPCAGDREGRAVCAACAVTCATRPRKVYDVCWRLEVVLYALERLEGTRRVLLWILEAVEGELCLPKVLEALEVMRCVLLGMSEAVEVSEVPEVLE